MARARPVGGAAVPGNADDADLHIGQARIVGADMGQAHEGGRRREARYVHAGDRLEGGVVPEGGHGRILLPWRERG